MEEIPSLAEVGEGRNLISQTLRSLTDTTGAENIVKGSIQLAKIWLNLSFGSSNHAIASTHPVLSLRFT
jgi:hypothetical protein